MERVDINMTGNYSVAFVMMGSNKVQTYSFDNIDINTRKGYYEIAVKGTGRGKKFLVSKKELSKELEKLMVNTI